MSGSSLVGIFLTVRLQDIGRIYQKTMKKKTMPEAKNLAGERLWEKLEYHRKLFDLGGIDLEKPFSLDQFEAKNPKIRQLINEVQEEFSYELRKRQCSWIVVSWIAVQFLKINIQEYNKHNNLNLQARA